MSETVFPYPGGKSQYADWITQYLPKHSIFVEAFGGAAGVTANKPRSHSEVYNDINNDLVVFFRVLRDQPQELKRYLERLPYSRAEYERIAESWFSGDRPESDVERAAWFFYLRHANYSGKLTEAGFSTSARADDNRARRYANRVDAIEEYADRFRDVTVENLDYRGLIDQYDTPETVFYFDPPYVDVGDDYYGHSGEFDHGAFVGALNDITGEYVVSYGELPEGLGGTVVERGQRYTMSSEGHEEKTERLVLSFDPEDTRLWSKAGQSGLGRYS